MMARMISVAEAAQQHGDPLPLPVLRERAGVRVMANVDYRSTFEITLILTFSRRTGRRDRNAG
jgi:hypothetical protein